jgi:hypothetical protein
MTSNCLLADYSDLDPDAEAEPGSTGISFNTVSGDKG